jgi:hypothetical protein
MELLPKPQIVRCYFDASAPPPLSAMELQWDPDAPGVMDRTWHLPGNVLVKGPAPECFGVTIQRSAQNSYQVQVLWNNLRLGWAHLSRTQIMSSSLASILRSLDTDLWYLLEQPVTSKAAA